MTILQALERRYHQIPEEERTPEGWAREYIGWCVVLNPAGKVVDIEDLRETVKDKMRSVRKTVPKGAKRTSGISSNFLWDKSEYVLGRAIKETPKTVQRHAAFRDLHRLRISDSDDEGLHALWRFIEAWNPSRFNEPPFHPDMLDANIVFRLDGNLQFIHERQAVRLMVEKLSDSSNDLVQCLVTGEMDVATDLHDNLKGLPGANGAGAALVSFNADAFLSHGLQGGGNAPTGRKAAHRYAVTLNHLLETGYNSIRGSDREATTVFWAHVPGKAPQIAETWAAVGLGAHIGADEERTTIEKQVRDHLRQLSQGKGVEEVIPDLSPDTTFHVLGLSPNNARVAVRYWEKGSFGAFATRIAKYHAELEIEPSPAKWPAMPSVRRLLIETTIRKKEAGKGSSSLPHGLADDVMRAIISDARHPRRLLTAVLARLKAGDNPTWGWHAAVIRSFLARDARLSGKDPNKEIPVAIDINHPEAAYHIGRLFAVYEQLQEKAIPNVNTTIRDRYYSSAMTTPRSVLTGLERLSTAHLTKVRRQAPGIAFNIKRQITEIWEQIGGEVPRVLDQRQQGLFVIGYHHQRGVRFQASVSTGESRIAGSGDEVQAGILDDAPETEANEAIVTDA